MRSGSGVSLMLSTAAVLGLTACGSAAAPSGGAVASTAVVSAPAPASSASTPAPTISSPTGTTTVPVDPEPSDPIPPPAKVPTRTVVTLAGTPQPGVESGCLVIDAYVLIGGDRALLGSGAKLSISGHTQPDLASYCQQGTPLVVDSASRVS